MGLAHVRANYFDVTGMRITAGRGFNREDGRDVAVVNEVFATSRGGHVIGRLVHVRGASRAFRKVGVVSNVKTFGIADTETRYHVYLSEAKPNP